MCISASHYGCDNLVPILHLFNIENWDILKVVKKIKANNVSGPDHVPAFIVKDCIRCFLTPLVLVCTQVLH